jgi:hypothetical protein
MSKTTRGRPKTFDGLKTKTFQLDLSARKALLRLARQRKTTQAGVVRDLIREASAAIPQRPKQPSKAEVEWNAAVDHDAAQWAAHIGGAP